MKKDIHPQYFPEAKIKCACGASFKIGATRPELRVEICSNCHPFYTGKEKIVDTAGRVEKFKGRISKATESVKSKREKKAVKRTKKSDSKKK